MTPLHRLAKQIAKSTDPNNIGRNYQGQGSYQGDINEYNPIQLSPMILPPSAQLASRDGLWITTKIEVRKLPPACCAHDLAFCSIRVCSLLG